MRIVIRMVVLQVLENKKNRRINERKKHPPEWQQHFPRTSPPSWQQFLDKLGAGFTGGESRYYGPSLQCSKFYFVPVDTFDRKTVAFARVF